MNPGETLYGRYEIIRELGRGGAGVTWLARDTSTGREVVAKVLHLGLLGDWKAVELFQREASVLKGLHHERIPAYVDYFSADLEGAQRFVLVREYVEGASLQARVESGWRATEEKIRDIGARLARIVAYIHSVRPPVIHRDINPRNIIMRDDGEVFLVDFGGVQDAIRLSSGGTSTIVGTPGYTPMEQFVGRASVRSDLYAMAATLLFLLTHRNPADLPVKEMKVDFSSVIEITAPGLSRVLASWLEPDEGKRRLGIEDAIALLEGKAPPGGAEERGRSSQPDGTAPSVPGHPPHGSRITRAVEGDAVRYLVPGAGRGRGLPGIRGLHILLADIRGVLEPHRLRHRAELDRDADVHPVPRHGSQHGLVGSLLDLRKAGNRHQRRRSHHHAPVSVLLPKADGSPGGRRRMPVRRGRGSGHALPRGVERRVGVRLGFWMGRDVSVPSPFPRTGPLLGPPGPGCGNDHPPLRGEPLRAGEGMAARFHQRRAPKGEGRPAGFLLTLSAFPRVELAVEGRG